MLIKSGSVLIIPRKGTHDDVGSHVADNGQLSLAPEIATRRTVVKAGRNDSVTSVARRYKLNAVQVADWNNVGVNAAFKSGQQVVLYVPLRSARAPVRAIAKQPIRAKAAAKPAARRAPAQVTKKRR